MFTELLGGVGNGARAGLGAVQNGRAYVDSLANKYIVKPKHARGMNGFLFDYEGETALHLQAEITDHYTEDNTAIQNHVAIRPLKLNLRGFIGEVVVKKPVGLLGAIDEIQNKLTTVTAYLGKYTPGMVGKIQKGLTTATKTVNTIDQSLARVKNVVDMFPGAVPGLTKQQQAFNKLQAMFYSRQVMVVVTPFAQHDNMMIETIMFLQDEKTSSWSDISVTLKQVHFIGTKSTTTPIASNRNSQQSSPNIDKGSTAGTPQTDAQSTSLFKQVFGK